MAMSTETPSGALPNEPLFQRILEHATERPNDVAISDQSLGIQADYVKIFMDFLHMRDTLRRQMESYGTEISPEKPYISLLMPANYEFVIAVLAILASGGAFAPIRFGGNAERSLQSIKRCQSSCVVYGSQEEDFAIEIQRLASTNQYPIQIIPFESSTAPRPSQLSDLGLHLNTTTEVSLDSPAMVMFSSGTTSGKPKGIMHSRRFFNRPYRLPPQAVFLTLTDPFHLMSHLNAMIAPILGGCQMKIIDRVDAPAEVWEQLRSGRVRAFSALPNHWEDMAWYYRNKIHPMPEEVRESYLQGAQKVLYPYVTATVAPASLFRFWSEDLKRPLLNAFGTTELGGLAMSTSMDTVSKHHKCIGKPPPYVTAKLSKGDHGELLIKTPTAMSGYLFDPELTKSVFDEDGFYRTGDIAHLANDEYIYEGRIKHATKDFPLETENALSALSYLTDVLAVPVPFPHEHGTHIIGVVARILPPSSMTRKLEDHVSECLRRLHVSINGLYLQFDCKVPFAVRIQLPGDTQIYSRGDVEGLFPYSKDPTFKPDMEFAVHRAWLN